MSSPRFDDLLPLDPELRELLREIAARQEARLLRPDPPRSIRELMESSCTIREGATGLIAAERQLLRRHREEVAFLLHALAKERLREEESFERMFSARVPAPDACTDVDPGVPRARLLEERRRLENDFPAGDARELLEAARVGWNGSSTVKALAHAALSLVPSTEARFCLAADLVRCRALDAALDAFLRLRETAALPTHRASAASWRGLVLGKRGAFHSAVEAHKESSRGHPTEAAYLCNWLASALQSGDHGEMMNASDRLEERVSVAHPGVDSWLARIYEQRSLGDWHPTPLALTWSERLMDTVDPVSRRILHAFL